MNLRASAFFFLLFAHGGLAAAERLTWLQLDARAKEQFQQGKLEDAAATLREAIPLAEKEAGPVYDSVGRELNNLARVLTAQKNYAEAERVLLRAAGMADKFLAEDDPDRLRSLRELARVYVAEEKYALAEPLYLRLIQWQEKHVGPQYADVANTQMELSGVYAKLGRKEDADRLARRSFASIGTPARAQGMVPMAPDVYTDAQKSAAVAIDLSRRHNETIADQCISRSHDNEFRFSLHMWQNDNLEVVLAANDVIASTSAAQLKAFADQLDHSKTPNAAPNDALCTLISRSLRNGQLAYMKTDTEAAKAMQAIFTKNEAMRIAKRDADLSIGCMKRYYNNGNRDFGLINGQCTCLTRAIKANATDAQIDDWLTDLGSKTSGMPANEDDPEYARAAGASFNRDWMLKAMEAAGECVAPAR